MTTTLEELQDVFYNLSRSLEVLYVLHDLKKGIRIDANEIELPRIKQFCSRNNLHYEVSDFKAIKIVDEGKGCFANQVKLVDKNHSSEGVFHIYISKDSTVSQFLKLLEQRQDDHDFGLALGYPECCVDFFMKYNSEAAQKDLVLFSLRNSKNIDIPFGLNVVSRYFDYTLLSHFPCSMDCNHSLVIAQKRFELLSNLDRVKGQEIEAFLKNPVLYTEKDGVFVFHGTQRTDSGISYNDVQGTTKNELFDLLKLEGKLDFIDATTVIVGTKRLEGVGFFIFT